MPGSQQAGRYNPSWNPRRLNPRATTLDPDQMIVISRDRAAAVATPHGSEIRPLIDRTTCGITACSLAEETLPPGCAVAPHRHRQIEEIYYVVSGTGVMSVGDERREVGPGDAIYIPRGTRHTLENTGEAPIRLLLVCGPAFFYEDSVFDNTD